jgi:hypothetical protein
MKYFTPELIVMGQSDEDRVLNEQSRLWDEAGERYVAYLDSIRPQLPAGLRHIDNSYYLHDSQIQAMGHRDRGFVIVLQLDPPPQSILTFTYDLLENPAIIKGALPAEHCGCGPLVDWQYDEIEMVAGSPPTWRQTILLSNGWELTLHFRDVQVQEVQALIPPPRNGHTAALASSVSQPV